MKTLTSTDGESVGNANPPTFQASNETIFTCTSCGRDWDDHTLAEDAPSCEQAAAVEIAAARDLIKQADERARSQEDVHGTACGNCGRAIMDHTRSEVSVCERSRDDRIEPQENEPDQSVEAPGLVCSDCGWPMADHRVFDKDLPSCSRAVAIAAAVALARNRVPSAEDLTESAVEALKPFLYILLRDHLPAGVLWKIMRDHIDGRGDHLYSCQHTAGLAEDIVRQILKAEKGDES